MRQIVKGKEPKEWKQYRATEGVSYESIPELRLSLLQEQGWVCAYCMQRIWVDGSKIEHIKCRENYTSEELNYSNMVICCNGITKSVEHCDTSKQSKDISLNPFSCTLNNEISYASGDGTIKHKLHQNDLDKVLNLNDMELKNNRLDVINKIIVLIGTDFKLNKLKKIRNDWASRDIDNKHKEYYGIAVWYIDKKLKQYK